MVDVRFGVEHPRKDLDQNTIATSNVLEAKRANDIGRIRFPRPPAARIDLARIFMIGNRWRDGRSAVQRFGVCRRIADTTRSGPNDGRRAVKLFYRRRAEIRLAACPRG